MSDNKTMQKKHPCKYCGKLTTCTMCATCKNRYDLVLKLKRMKPPQSKKGVDTK